MKNINVKSYGIMAFALLLIAVTFLAACTSENSAMNSTNDSNGTQLSNTSAGSQGKIYVKTNPAECKAINFMCTVGMQPFRDSKGCGCEPKISNDTQTGAPNTTQTTQGGPMIPYNGTNTTGPAHFTCSNESRNAQMCYEIYQPVCGWFNSTKVQCVTYPCAQTFSNDCFACQNQNVAYYTQGKCPSPGIVN